MASELLQLRAGVKWSQIYYRGKRRRSNDLIGGHVDAGFGQLSDSLQHIQSGKLRALAVLGKKRIAVLPDVPTMEEAGYGGIEAENFVGILAPKKTPSAVVDKLSAAVREALAQKAVVDQVAAHGGRSARQHPGGVHALPAGRDRALDRGGSEGPDPHHELTPVQESCRPAS